MKMQYKAEKDKLSGEEEFNKGFILPSLLIQLRKILEQYPDDLQILKELIQNADDAGATVVKFLYDSRTYKQDPSRLLSPGLAKYQGPALYAYNDAQFTEDDWKGIRMLLQSVKEKDPHKVGFFGMGFKSVFHVTDLPSILSGDRLGIIDPLRQLFDASGSHAWNLSQEGPTVFRAAKHQTEAYIGTFGCQSKHFESGRCPYPGTLFRFPLRASASALSDTVYGSERIRVLLDRFEADAHLNLLFLRNVETIEVYERSTSTRIIGSAADAELRYRVSLTDDTMEDVRRKRKEFNERSRRSNNRDPLPDRPIISTYRMTISATKFTRGRASVTATSSTLGARYLVTNYHSGGPVSAALRKLHQDPELRLLPCVGTAMSLDDVTNAQNGGSALTLPYSEGGRVFCFLPLPDDGSTVTGLPVHVNGSFALEANRKHLKWPSSVAASSGGSTSGSVLIRADEHLDPRLVWNQCLLREAVPYCYAAMLIEAIRLHGLQKGVTSNSFSVSAIYHAIPKFDDIERRWECILAGLFGEIFLKACVYTSAGGGQWIEARHAVFNTLAGTPDAEAAPIILPVLREAGVKITDAPPHVQLAIRRSSRLMPTEISPTVVSAAVRIVQSRTGPAMGGQVFQIDWDSNVLLLRYFLRHGRIDLLDGLKLLPLANGGFETFRYNPRKADRPIFVAPSIDVYKMLIFAPDSSLEGDFLDPELDKDMKKMLLEGVKKGYTQLTLVTGAEFCQLLHRAMPRHWTHTNNSVDGSPPQLVEWHPGGEDGQPPVEWLESIWRYLTSETPEDLAPVDRLPLVPARTQQKAAKPPPKTIQSTLRKQLTRTISGGQTSGTPATFVVELVPLYSPMAGACIVRKSDGGMSLGHELEAIVAKLGVRVIDALPDYVRAHPLVERKYVFTSSYLGVLNALQRQASTDGRRAVFDRFSERLTASERRRVRELFSKLSEHELNQQYRELLAQLPLFEIIENKPSGRRQSVSVTPSFCCAAEVNVAAPVERISTSSSSEAGGGQLPFPVSKRLLDVSTPDALALARLLGIRLLEPTELLVDVVFGDIRSGFHDDSGVRRVASYVLHHFRRLNESDSRFKPALQTLSFVEQRRTPRSSSGGSGCSFFTADRLYDPDDELIRRMFVNDERWYPASAYCDPASLVVLREIGLRGSSCVDPTVIVKTAVRVTELASDSRVVTDRIGEKSLALLEYLQRYPSVLDQQVTTANGTCTTVAAQLANIAWLRRQVNRPSTFYPSTLPWYSTSDVSGRSAQFHRPSEMMPRRYASTVGSTMPLVGVELVASSIEKAFSWNSPPPVEFIVRHLSNVVCSFSGGDKPMYAEIARSIYSELVRHIEPSITGDVHSVATDAGQDHATALTSIMSLIGTVGLRSWIWHGDGFAPPDRVVVTVPTFADLRPYVYGLPVEMTSFCDSLLYCAGVRLTCRLVDVLRSIKTKYDDSSGSPRSPEPAVTGAKWLLRKVSSANRSKPQVATSDVRRDLHICVSVLNELKSQITSGCFNHDELEMLRQELFLPVHNEDRGLLVMVPLVECTYCDEEWLQQGYSISDFGINADDNAEKVFLVHPNVPTSTSERLGVPTLMSRMLASEQTLDFGFGQTDSLTGRLKALLNDYSDGLAIPKELIQNADDAGATEVRFLYDERDNTDARSCLLDEGMRECQGPALWVYNDAVFNDTDFENITRLGAATKVSRTDQIGQFGLGFNSVYNVTDVPSFISSHSVVIFDPQTTHLGRCIRDKSRPGVRIDLRRHRRALRRFGNQFRPWDGIFGCDLLRSDAAGKSNTSKTASTAALTKQYDSYPGTLFRLPLRTAAQAKRSEICNRPYDDREMKELLRMIVSAAESLLIFSQNVVRIGVYHLPKRSTSIPRDMVQIFTVERKLIKVIRELSPVVDLPASASTTIDVETRRLIKNSSLLRSSTLVISQLRTGVDRSKMSTPDCSVVVGIEALFNGKHATALLERPGVSRHQIWLICSVMGSEDSLQMALSEDGLVPSAAVAVRLEALGESYSPIAMCDADSLRTPAGYAFSFLPLPIRTGLPVHVNGCFLVASSRKHLCEMNEDDKLDPRPAWNRALFRDAVCTSYIRALTDIATLCTFTNSNSHYELWPNPQFASTACDALVQRFFRNVTSCGSNSSPSLFTDGQRWGSVQDTIFLEGAYASSVAGAVALQTFNQCLSGSSKIVCFLPDWIESSLRVTGAFENIASSYYSHFRFFEEVLLPHVADVETEHRNSLVKHALTISCEKIQNLLRNTPCIPCSPDGISTDYPHNLIDPSSVLASMYLPEEGKFPHTSYTSFEVIGKLRQLGMKHDYSSIRWEEVINRAGAVSTLNEPVIIHRFVSGILNVLDHKLVNAADERQNKLIPSYREQICDIAFFPVMQQPTGFHLPWFGKRAGLVAKPNELYNIQHKDLICCVRPVADMIVINRTLSEEGRLEAFLQLQEGQKIPSEQDVLQQLETVVETAMHFGVPEECEDFSRILFRVCDYLQNCCSDNPVSRQQIGNRLSSLHFILTETNHIVPPDQVAFVFPHDCSPYLSSLPDTYRRRFGELVIAAGVCQQFKPGAYVGALRRMYDQYGSKPLDVDALPLALRLATLLNDCMTEASRTIAQVVDTDGIIFIPDSNGVLRSASDLCYNEPDCHWMQGSTLDTGENEPHPDGPVDETLAVFSHPLIPYAMSRQLGVSTRRHDVLQRHSRGLAFGQHERLTARLRRILAAYPCDRELLNEMVQNADDAGSTMINFIKDPRRHGHERIFDPSWRDLQGPALCIYNDRTFTEQDLTAIQRLGEGRKSTDLNATGQYGVGFNCVYHLTDVPSFLTGGPDPGGTLCVFDPHAKMVPGATRDEPGRRFTDISRLRKIFTDVFTGYLVDKGFDIVNGTMFRLPLRDEHMACISELSDQVVTLDSVDRLFERFKPEMFDSLLFLNSVRSIQLSEIDEHSGILVNTYTVVATLSSEDQLKRDEFVRYAKKVSEDLSSGTLNVSNIPNHEIVYCVRLSDNHGKFETWLVSQRLGFAEELDVPNAIVDGFRRGELRLMPRGGAAALIESSDCNAVVSRARRISCFLPLPIKLHFPVSINGHFALDHESRRNLWHDDAGGSKTVWNRTLIQSVISKAYVSLLQGICSARFSNTSIISKWNVEQYCQLFPRISRDMAGYLNILTESFYKAVVVSEAGLFPVVRKIPELLSFSTGSTGVAMCLLFDVEWHSLASETESYLYFDNLNETIIDQVAPTSIGARRRQFSETPCSPSKPTDSDCVRSVLLDAGFNLVAFPVEVCESFLSTGAELRYVTPSAVINFLSSRSCGFLDNLPMNIANTPFSNPSTLKLVVEYCMQDIKYFIKNLEGLPLLLRQDGSLTRFSVLQPIFLSSFCNLFPGQESQFLHNMLCELAFANFESIDVFKSLDVRSMAELLPKVLPGQIYRYPNMRALRSSEENGPPTGTWLAQAWSFLRLEYDKCLRNSLSTVPFSPTLASNVVEPLSEWCLLPVKLRVTNPTNVQSTNEFERVLVPIGIARIVFDYSHAGIMTSHICRCLSKLGVAELDCESLDTNPWHRLPESVPLVSAPGIVVATTNSSFVRLLVSTLDHPDAVICAISHAVTDYSVLSREDCFCLLRYFAESIEEWRNDEALRLSLRRTTLFVTITGFITSLAAAKHVYVINDQRFPDCEMENWQNDFGVVFLQYHHPLVQLYEVLGCDELSVLGFYTDFVFPNFARLSPESRVSYLEFLRDSCLPNASVENRTICIAWLRRLEFIPSTNSNAPLRRADAFYDPQHQLLKRMLTASGDYDDKSIFPGHPFSDVKWLEFLRMAGLRTEIGADMFKQFAMSIADETARHGSNPRAFERSRSLVTYLFRSKELESAGFLESLENIKFIASSQGSAMLQKIHPAFRRTFTAGEGVIVVEPPVFIAFHEGVPEKYEPLCWTAVPLLPDWANPYLFHEQESSHSINWQEVGLRLKIHEKPTLEHVVNHVLNICSTRKSSSSVRTTLGKAVASQTDDLKAFLLADTMKKIYRFLQSNILNARDQERGDTDELKNSQVIARLSNTAFVVVDQGKTFLCPSQVVMSFRSEDQLAPFLYRLPSELVEFRDLFLLLGATMYATPGQYSEVLTSLYNQTEGKRLHPNELRLAIRAMRGVFTSLRKADEEKTDFMNDVSTLYLLTNNGFLRASNSIIHNDCSTFADRLKHVKRPLMLDLTDYGFHADTTGAFADLFKLLPDHLRPNLISAMITEVMDERFVETRAVTPLTERLRTQLTSRSFGLGLARLVGHEQRQRSSTANRHLKANIDEIRQRFERVEVYIVDRVVTYLMDQETRQRLADSESEAEWFVERSSPAASIEVDMQNVGDIWRIYISKLVIDGEELQTHVADAVCAIANGQLSSVVHYVRPILSCAPHAISRTLDRLRIRRDNGQNSSEAGERRRTALPPPGSFVPIEEHHLLRDDFAEFEPGEYVGYELDENDHGDMSCYETTVVYAIVIRKVGCAKDTDDKISPESTDDELGDFNDKIRSGIATEDNGTTHIPFIDKYLLNIGDDRRPVVVQSVNIYKFHRIVTILPKTSQSPLRSPLSPGSSTSSKNSIHREQPASTEEPHQQMDMRSVANVTKIQTSHLANGNSSSPSAQQQQQQQQQNGGHINLHSPSRSALVKFTFDSGRSNRDSTSSSDTSGVETDPESIDARVSAAFVEVTDALEAAWKLPEPQRRKVIRRLLLRWHPDKNVGDEQMATAVTQHIRSEMERIEEDIAWKDGRFKVDPRNPFASSESFRRHFAEAYRFFFDQMDERAREQKAQRERYKECFTREYSFSAGTNSADNTPSSPNARRSAGGFDSRVPPPSFTSCNPQPAQARRFLRQAREDLKSAENDVNCKEPAYEWACFKAYQAAKKALKAALIYVDSSNLISSHEVVILAAGLDDPELARLARDLDRVVAETGRKLYAPDPIDYAVIPHDEHTAETASAAHGIASAIIGHVGDLIDSS